MTESSFRADGPPRCPKGGWPGRHDLLSVARARSRPRVHPVGLEQIVEALPFLVPAGEQRLEAQPDGVAIGEIDRSEASERGFGLGGAERRIR